MKTQDLRIGNYFKIGLFNKKLTKELLVWYLEGGANNFKPIPLTEEWLVKFGYPKKIGRLKIDCEFGIILIPFKPYKIECQYVHQFQNLYFALTGKELNEKTNSITKD